MSKRKIYIVLFILCLTLPNLLFGASIDMKNTLSVLEAVRIAFVAICGVATTIMIIYTGFKFWGGNQPLRELTPHLWAIAAFGSATAIGAFVDSAIK